MPFAQVNDVRLYYELQGAAQQPVVLFLHGLGSSTRDWEFQTSYFQAKYRVLLIDMRGHGQSDKPQAAYSMPQFAKDIVALLDQLKIDKVHVVGLSMGGMIAFQMAVDYPERFHSMTIANSGPAVIFRTLNEKSKLWLRFIIVRFMGMRKMGEMLAPRLFVDANQDNLRQTFINRWAENDPKAYMNSMRAIAGWTVEAQIHKINIPTLVIASDQDYTPIAMKEAYIAKMSNVQLQVIQNAHHAVPTERPDAFNEVVANFLQSI